MNGTVFATVSDLSAVTGTRQPGGLRQKELRGGRGSYLPSSKWMDTVIWSSKGAVIGE